MKTFSERSFHIAGVGATHESLPISHLYKVKLM